MGTTGQSITLANSIIGVGILAMPFCFQQCGILLATLILLSMGLVSRLCCYFLLKSAIITRRRTYEFLAFHVFGPAGKMAIETGIIGFLMGTCIAYFVVVGDLGPQIIAKLLNINQSDILRTSIMVIVSVVCVLPLGLLRNVDSLSNVSAATIAFYFCLVIKVITEATSQLLTSDWHTRIEMWKPSGLLQCVPIFSMALFCQTQLFEIFDALPSLSLEKMCVVTKNAINICASVYFTLGLFGYIAFGAQDISGNILMSLSPTMASDVIKLGFVMSLAFSFPLIIFPCRASLYSFLYRKAHPSHHDHMISHGIPETSFRLLTVGIVGVALVVSLLLPNIELVLGLLGSTIGVLVCVVFPAACFVNVTFKDTNERILAKFIVVLGLIILVLGTYANLQAAENTRDKYEDFTKERIDKFVEDFFQKQEQFKELKEKPLSEMNPEPPKETNILDTDIVKESEVQPPNPVPPELSLNENMQDRPLSKIDGERKEVVENVLDKVSESHPKNVQIKTIGEKNANGKAISTIEEVNQPIKIKEDKSDSDKIEIQKQQQLIETIRQHGEEQKELIQEQKEILDGLLKTKEEIQKNKKEVDSKEVKIKAVESIQQIAKMAIQSIGGVTDKPDQGKDKPVEPIKDIAAEAVNEIAKKAVETLVAIKQIDEKEKSVDIKDENHIVKEVPNQINEKVPSKLDTNDAKRVQKQIVNPSNGQLVKDEHIRSVEKTEVIREVDNVLQKINEINLPKSIANVDEKVVNNDIASKANEKQEILKRKIVEKPVETPSASNMNLKNAQNIPLPIAVNENSKTGTENKNNVVNTNLDNNGALSNSFDTKSNKEPIVSLRQKREVVDCTQKTTLKPEDKQICENLVNSPNVAQPNKEVLPQVDLADVSLSKSLPIPLMAVHHIRSLKSVEDKKR